MNILQALNKSFNSVERDYAHITGIKSDGTLIAETPAGSTVLLQGKADIGKSVFYDRVSGNVLGDAPTVEFNKYGV